MLVCVDNGFDSTKVRTKSTLSRFISKWEVVNEGEEIEYNGEKWSNTGNDDIETDKTKSIIHKLCTLKALAENCNYSQEFNLVVNLPLIHYRNKQFREEFKNYMSYPNKDYITYKGVNKELIIRSCTVAPQAISALYSDAKRYKDKLVGVIDLGGLTIDCCIVNKLKPIAESITTINLGDRIIESTVKTKVNEKYLLNIQGYEVEDIIKNGIIVIKESKEYIEGVINNCLDNLFRELRTKNWSLETLEIVLVGGGALKYYDILSKRIRNLTKIDNPIYANVNGLYTIGMMQNG